VVQAVLLGGEMVIDAAAHSRAFGAIVSEGASGANTSGG
jgi:hypothetical protein